MIDKDVVFKHLNELQRINGVLEELKCYSLEDLTSDFKKQLEVERALQIAIQNLLDVGSHILSSLGKNRCNDYADVIDKLGSERIIPADFALKIRGMAGLRNILVHEYLELDLKKVYEILQNQLGDFHVFTQHILTFIEKPIC